MCFARSVDTYLLLELLLERLSPCLVVAVLPLVFLFIMWLVNRRDKGGK
jgi:hypothetical protein